MLDDSIVIETVIRVRVMPERMKASSTMMNHPPAERARQIIHNATLTDMRWLTGVEEVIFAKTRFVEEPTHGFDEVVERVSPEEPKAASLDGGKKSRAQRPKAGSRAPKPKAQSKARVKR